ncbi:permease [Tsukamurella sp. 8F]|uniref:permease n=1 Tax=unclassified Tsukamurella TaxID=2633480 RepID=UPI0023B9BECE|nr:MULTISPECIES: permease [unclassified Tsukamurella]MDF0528342.1 permease [Tsukamurella sp. 8J]MDF0586167.1 permease [Tsukamurella sp. 8F]
MCLAAVFGRALSSGVDGSAELRTAATVFVGIFVQATPFLVLGVLVSGLIAGFVSPRVLERVLPRRGASAVAAAGLSGVALPGCECSAVPVAGRLMDRGVPAAVAVTFLLAAPAINPVVVVATVVAFPGQPEVAGARVVGSLATAVVTGWIWLAVGRPEWIRRPRTAAPDQLPDGAFARLSVAAATAREDLVEAGSFLAVGAAFAAALHVLVPASWFEHLASDMLLAVVVMAVLAVVLALCSEADAFVAASLSALPLLPRIVFLVVGPAVDVKLMTMQAGAFGRRFVARFAPLTMVVAVGCALGAGTLLVGWR